MYCFDGLAWAYLDHSRGLEVYARSSDVRCGRLAVGVWARELAIESRRWLKGEPESGGRWVVGWAAFVCKSERIIRCLPGIENAKRKHA